MEEWLTIRELARQGLSQLDIARRTGRDPKTIRKVPREERPAPGRRVAVARTTKLAPFHEYLLSRTATGCWNAVVLADEPRPRGYTGGLTRIRDFLRPLRHEQRRQREATVRFETEPGQQAQVDWGHFGRIWDHAAGRWRALYGFVFTLGYSRAQYLVFTTSADSEHFLACHLAAFAALGLPERILYDNLKTAILERHADGTPVLPGRFADFALYYGFTPAFCQPYRPRTKGKVERSIGYVRQNFWPRVSAAVIAGTLDLRALNGRAVDWVQTVAHQRVHGTTGEVVAARLAREQPDLGRLDARPRYDTAYQHLRRVGRDGHLSYQGQLYAVPLRYALATITVREALEGDLTLVAPDGHQLPTVLVGTDPLSASVAPAPRPTASQDTRPLPLLGGAPAPVVPVRDLAVYEEVAHAAAAS
ncbi:MAG: IS21 family transposase [Chloroflexi bacterium]|nr:IS21 family transposase [Chloroflexota bacterium]